MIIQPLDYYLDPSSVASCLANYNHFVFLDSSDQQNNSGYYSVIGVEPFLIFSFSKGKCRLKPLIQKSLSLDLNLNLNPAEEDNPFIMLKGLLKEFQEIPSSFYPFPLGGCLGYISYDLGASSEAGVYLEQGFKDWPELEMGFYDALLIFDHRQKKIIIVSTGLPFKGIEQEKRADQRFLFFLQLLDRIRNLPGQGPGGVEKDSGTAAREKAVIRAGEHFQTGFDQELAEFFLTDYTSNFTADGYQEAVRIIKEYIARGDVYQVNLSQQFSGQTIEPGFNIYNRIRQVNRVPYGGYLRFDNREILCFSMECFLRMEGRQVKTRPIKGTRPRGKNQKEDQIQAEELFHSEKDRAELIMVVDMERNDLGKVCDYNSVQVDQLLEIEKYATVFHLVSTVTGRLKSGIDHLDCLLACFPGGSITGTPKIRSMQIIAELERVRRGVYCGALGYFGFNGVSDFNIPIRTILKQETIFWFNAGGGVVIDSEPHLEYLETLHKVRSFLEIIKSPLAPPAVVNKFLPAGEGFNQKKKKKSPITQ